MLSYSPASLLVRSDSSRAFELFQGLFSNLHPSAIKLATETQQIGASDCSVTILQANCALERAIIRKVCAEGSAASFEGGWYGASGIESELLLSPQEAEVLFGRLYTEAQSFLARELSFSEPTLVYELLENLNNQNAVISERRVAESSGCERLVGCTVTTTQTLDKSNNSIEFELNASFDEDPSKTYVTITLRRNGFSASSALAENQENEVISLICQKLGLECFHLHEARLPHTEQV